VDIGTGNSISCDYLVIDDDGDNVSVSHYWLKNNEYFSNNTTIHNHDLFMGDEWTCERIRAVFEQVKNVWDRKTETWRDYFWENRWRLLLRFLFFLIL